MNPSEHCEIILKLIKESNLHYVLNENAFSLQIKIKKKFIDQKRDYAPENLPKPPCRKSPPGFQVVNFPQQGIFTSVAQPENKFKSNIATPILNASLTPLYPRSSSVNTTMPYTSSTLTNSTTAPFSSSLHPQAMVPTSKNTFPYSL